MINYKMENNGVAISLMIDSKEVETDTKKVLEMIEKASTIIEVKEIKDVGHSFKDFYKGDKDE